MSYGRLVGQCYGYEVESSSRNQGHHLLLKLRVAGEPYTAAVNIQSRTGSSLQSCLLIEQVTDWQLFREKIDRQVYLSYYDLNLRQGDFETVSENELYYLLVDLVNKSKRVIIYGVILDDLNIIHDIHLNSGEARNSKWSNHPNQDGAIGFLIFTETGEATIHWVYLKFQTQSLISPEMQEEMWEFEST
jgi:hypothetical protein